MDIIIPTLGRINDQVTYNNLPHIYARKVKLLVQPREYIHYNIVHRLMRLPEHIRGISNTRDWLVHENLQASEKLVMLDDDLVFAARRDDEPSKFRAMTELDYICMFNDIEAQLDEFVMVGVSHREGANRNTNTYVDVTRQMRVQAFNIPKMRELGVRLNRLNFKSDFDTVLQLLRLGYANRLCNRWVHNQKGSNTTGGCSLDRTPEEMDSSSRGLAELHPGFVKVVEKETKKSWGGGKRIDVNVQWKKAHADGNK